jgi:hypothetical protein
VTCLNLGQTSFIGAAGIEKVANLLRTAHHFVVSEVFAWKGFVPLAGDAVCAERNSWHGLCN